MAKKVNAFLSTPKQGLQGIFAQLRELKKLNEKLATYLEPHLAKHCQIVNIVENRLIIMASNGAYATQIRFMSADLMTRFKQDPLFKHIRGIHCKVHPILTPREPRASQHSEKMILSDESAEIIYDIAQSLTDPKLKASLEKLSRNKKK